MEATKVQGVLFAEQREDAGQTVFINGRCQIRTHERHRLVLVSGVPIIQYIVGDRAAEALAMVNLVEQGWADQNEVAPAFGCSTRTVRRHQRRFESGGLAALGRPAGYPTGRPRVAASRLKLVNRLRSLGCSNRGIAQRLGVCDKAARKLLRRLGWKPAAPLQHNLPLGGGAAADPNLSASAPPGPGAAVDRATRGADPNVSAFSSADREPLSISLDTDPSNRGLDRFLAHMGVLMDARPLFRPGHRVPGAGVLLSVPALVESGVFDCASEVYGSIGPAFYGLRTTVVTLLLMALLRIKRPEGLKEHLPDDLGRILGLDRAPEVKTLRRKLTRLAVLGRAVEFGRVLAKRRVAKVGEALGVLYVDGHVRVYHGQRTLPKAHVARMRISMPGTTDYWVNDRAGDPLFVVTAEANAGLVKMLPAICEQIRTLVGERRTTIVFDRGGWSPKLFLKIIAAGFDIMTYRKGRHRPVPERLFHDHQAVLGGREVKYLLADQGIRLMGGKLRLRQVTRLQEDGHQTPVVTSRRDLSAIEVAFWTFGRWRQENFFKYLNEEFALDALVDYRVEPDDPAREVPNPAWQKLDAEARKARAELESMQADYGVEALSNVEDLRRTMRGFKIANARIGRGIWAALRRYANLLQRRDKLPRRVPVRQVVKGEVIKLATERQHLTSVLKMVAYWAESDLFRQIAPHYKRVEDEGRTLIQTALNSAGDIEVSEHLLQVRLAPLSSAHRTRAIAALCDQLNLKPVTFPGTHLKLRFSIDQGQVNPKSGQM